MDAKRSFYRRMPGSAFTAEDRALKSAGGCPAAKGGTKWTQSVHFTGAYRKRAGEPLITMRR